jgi:hypothetical protein
MDKEQVIKLYGRNAYSIRIELAMHLYVQGIQPIIAFEKADQFIEHMLTMDHKPLKL